MRLGAVAAVIGVLRAGEFAMALGAPRYEAAPLVDGDLPGSDGLCRWGTPEMSPVFAGVDIDEPHGTFPVRSKLLSATLPDDEGLFLEFEAPVMLPNVFRGYEEGVCFGAIETFRMVSDGGGNLDGAKKVYLSMMDPQRKGKFSRLESRLRSQIIQNHRAQRFQVPAELCTRDFESVFSGRESSYFLLNGVVYGDAGEKAPHSIGVERGPKGYRIWDIRLRGLSSPWMKTLSSLRGTLLAYYPDFLAWFSSSCPKEVLDVSTVTVPEARALLWGGLSMPSLTGPIVDQVRQSSSESSAFFEVARERFFPGSDLLVEAASRGNVPVMTYCLESGVPIDRCEDEGGTAVYAAAYTGQLDAIKALHARGANMTATAVDGSLPFGAAIVAGHVDVVQYFIDKGLGDVNAELFPGYFPLFTAVDYGQSKVVDTLIRNGVVLDQLNAGGVSALDRAYIIRDAKLVRLLRKKGAKRASER